MGDDGGIIHCYQALHGIRELFPGQEPMGQILINVIIQSDLF
jgi:hypothetical protein